MVIYKAVVFDMGGVLMSYSKMPYIGELFQIAMKDLGAAKAWRDLEKGITTAQDDNDVWMDLLNEHPKLKAEVEKGMTSANVMSIFDNMIEDANFLVAVPNIRKAGFLTAILTNNAFHDEKRQRSIRMAKALESHDAVIESCRVGVRKPEKEIYLMTASKLGIEPDECIFVDDLRVNCEGAAAVGMKTVQEKKGDSLAVITELERLLEHKFM